MKLQSLGRLSGGVLLVATMWGCGAGSDDGEELGATSLGIGSWEGSNLTHVLRVNATETTVRNRCELTIPLADEKALTIIATQSVGGALSTTSVGWTGSAVSAPGLSVSGCSSYPCDVLAVRTGTASSGTTLGCEMIADDGVSRLVGTSSDSALTVSGAPAKPVVFHQHLDIGPTRIWGACILRQSEVVTSAQVSDFQVLLNGSGVVSLPGPLSIGNVAWPTKGPSVPFGSIYVGSETGATRLKHVTPIMEQLVEGDTLRCAGSFKEGSVPVFDVNVTQAAAGSGMTFQTAASEWTCSADAFGTGNGCDCDCGVLDPDCGTHDCTHFNVTASTAQNYTIDGQLDPALDLVKGRTYVFDVNTPGHPFAIHSVSGNPSTGVRYNDGVTGQAVTIGQLKFTPPLTAPSTVYYQCEVHPGMTGALNLADF